jgi:4'-phosphopantetheinyl transferase
MLELVVAHRDQLLPQIVTAGSGFLHQSERERWQSFGSDLRRKEFLSGHWLVRQLLLRTVGGSLADWQLESVAGQPPRLVGHPELFLSLSHSKGWLAAAVSDTAVGIDIEQNIAKSNILNKLDIVANNHEKHQIPLHPDPADQARLFTQGWVLKEAWLKQQGCGMDYALMRKLVYMPAAAGKANAQSWDLAGLNLHLALVGTDAGRCRPENPALQGGHYWQIST